MRPFLLAGLLLVLASCSPHVFGAPGWSFQALSTTTSVRLVRANEFGFCSDRLVGCTVPMGETCVIMLDRDYFLNGTPRQKTLLLAHEFGHCLDGSRLTYSHNHVGQTGQQYGAYYRAAVEGYAEAYAHAYLAACGTNLSPLGWEKGPGCTLPDPASVRPATSR